MPAPLVTPLDLSSVHVPPHFRCPISLELMHDPVTVSTGQTYDRASIESWVATGNTTCPVTRAPLDPAFTPIPNHTLRRLIQDWCVANRSQGVERIPTPVQPANPETVRALVAQAQGPPEGRRNLATAPSSSRPSTSSTASVVDSRVSAVRRLRALARESEKSRALVAEHRSAILSLAFRDCSTSSSGADGDADADDEVDGSDQPPSVSELSLESVALASALPLSDDDSASVASRPDRLAWLSRLLRHHPSLEARASAAGLIEAVSAGTRSQEHKAAIGAADGVMDGLVALLGVTISTCRSAARAAIKALFSLCLAKQNRDLAVSSGAATSLVSRIASASSPGDLDRSDLERALATVELLCRSRTGVDTLVASVETASLSASAMVGVMAGRASDRAAEHAAGALLSVCAESGAARATAVDGGVVPQLLLMVQGGCTDRGKRKAQALLKLLWSAAAWAPPQPVDGYRGEDEDAIEEKIRRRHQPHATKEWSVAGETGGFLNHHRQPQHQHAAALLR